MQLSIKKHINNLKIYGVTRIPNAASQKKCDIYTSIANQKKGLYQKCIKGINK